MQILIFLEYLSWNTYLLGKCKFGEKCSYSHDHHLHKDVTILKQEIEEIRQRLNEFVSELDAVKTSNAYQI